jgi:signal transduction histidine kinase
MVMLQSPSKGSIAVNLARQLGTFGALIFFVTLIGSVLIDAFQNPSQLRNAVMLNVIEKAIRSTSPDTFALDETSSLNEIKQSSSELWFVVSDGRALIEHNPSARPLLPVDIRIDGPSLSANFAAGGSTASIRTIDIQGFEGRVVLATTGARPGLMRVASYYLQVSGLKIFLAAAALAMLIILTVMLVIKQITRTIRAMAVAAAAIVPNNPKGELSSSLVPSELHPLTRALDAALDRIADSMEQRSRFISNAAHELRTPLAILRVKMEAINDHQTKTELISDLQRLTTLVSAMLDLARMNASGLEMGQHDLVALARQALSDHASSIIDRGMEAEFLSPSDPIMVQLNPVTILSAISNLIANAASHAQIANTLTIRVAADRVVEVSDNGIGVSVESRDEIVEPFASLSSTSKGSGLGLAIVREIMTAHGGSLVVSETPGGGLTVRLLFQ